MTTCECDLCPWLFVKVRQTIRLSAIVNGETKKPAPPVGQVYDSANAFASRLIEYPHTVISPWDIITRSDYPHNDANLIGINVDAGDYKLAHNEPHTPHGIYDHYWHSLTTMLSMTGN